MITHDDLKRLDTQDTDYDYTLRWVYISEVIKIVLDKKPDTVLELGPHNIQICEFSDIMDIDDTTAKYHQDATIVPWDIKDKAYDMFIALQVFEHLGSKQQLVFKEAMRTSKSAILTFPYKWEYDPEEFHIGIDKETIARWTLVTTPKKVVMCDRWILYYFEF